MFLATNIILMYVSGTMCVCLCSWRQNGHWMNMGTNPFMGLFHADGPPVKRSKLSDKWMKALLSHHMIHILPSNQERQRI